jgi:hypothetical protein
VSRLALIAIAAALLAACEDTVPAWQLDNDRIIAVRVTPPHIPAGGRATIDVLITAMGTGPSVATPVIAAVVPDRPDRPVPAALAGAVVDDAGAWTVVAPDAPTLDALRAELGLMPGVPIAIRVGLTVGFAPGPLAATKVVTLGDTGDNPVLGDVTVNGAAPTDGMTVPADTDIVLHAPALDTDEIDWLTSVGDLSDGDDPDAVLNHDTTADPPQLTSGALAVVKRDATGGVTWGFWTIAIAP